MNQLDFKVSQPFTAGNATLAAGSYVIRPVQGTDHIVMVEVESVQPDAAQGGSHVIFNKYKNVLALSQVFPGAGNTGYQLLQGQPEKLPAKTETPTKANCLFDRQVRRERSPPRRRPAGNHRNPRLSPGESVAKRWSVGDFVRPLFLTRVKRFVIFANSCRIDRVKSCWGVTLLVALSQSRHKAGTRQVLGDLTRSGYLDRIAGWKSPTSYPT
jgi:hypothetical protein